MSLQGCDLTGLHRFEWGRWVAWYVWISTSCRTLYQTNESGMSFECQLLACIANVCVTRTLFLHHVLSLMIDHRELSDDFDVKLSLVWTIVCVEISCAMYWEYFTLRSQQGSGWEGWRGHRCLAECILGSLSSYFSGRVTWTRHAFTLVWSSRSSPQWLTLPHSRTLFRQTRGIWACSTNCVSCWSVLRQGRDCRQFVLSD